MLTCVVGFGGEEKFPTAEDNESAMKKSGDSCWLFPAF